MSGEQAPAANAATKNKATRQRSSIGFPYMDLDSAVELANAIHSHVALDECDDDQLAIWSNQSAKASTFRVQVYTARTFGILEGDGAKHKLAELGRMIVDPNQAREGRARAFLAVPLYKAVFEKYKGGVLPPIAALERDFVALGVAEKQKERARKVLERSADQAGFFEHGKNRLVMPGIAHGQPARETPKTDPGNGGNGAGQTPPTPPTPPRHPFIEGLLQTLPDPEKEWAAAGRVKWLQTAANIFDLIYKGDGGIKIELALAQRSPRPGD
jgi:hypothetical protein